MGHRPRRTRGLAEDVVDVHCVEQLADEVEPRQRRVRVEPREPAFPAGDGGRKQRHLAHLAKEAALVDELTVPALFSYEFWETQEGETVLGLVALSGE